MVEYQPKGELPQYEDMTEDEIWELRRAFDILYMMIVRGQNLHDISRTASKLAERVNYPFGLIRHFDKLDVGEEE